MNKTLIMIFTALLFSVTLNAHAKKAMTENEKQTIASYQAKCIKQVGLALDVATRVCNCQSEGNLKHMTVKELALLIPEQKRLSQEEAMKIENEDPILEPLQSVEYDVRVKCEETILKKINN